MNISVFRTGRWILVQVFGANVLKIAWCILCFLNLRFVNDGVKVDAVVYLVDANDKERFAESKKELDALLLLDESLSNVLFLILGNKIDMHYAASEDELRY